MSEIYGLTVFEPWAMLLARPVGRDRRGRPVYAKRYETRGWATNYRGEIAIHAGAKPPREVLREIRDPAALREIGTALLPILYGSLPDFGGRTWQDVILELETYDRDALPRKAVLGFARLRGCHLITPELIARQPARELALGDWTPGRYAWEITDRRPCVPMTRSGAQGLWKY